MKKYLKIIVPIILIVILLICFYLKYQHSLVKMAGLIDKKNDIPDNVYLKKEFINNVGIITEEIYKKDKIIYNKHYTDAENEDIIWDFEKKQIILINHTPTKNISFYNIEGEGLTNPINEYFYGISEELRNSEKKYKYYGKENIDGKECIKFSLTDDEGYIMYYYIDIQKKVLYKIEYGLNYDNQYTFFYSEKYTYSENTVKNEDILEFDISNYPDYKVLEEE